ncbi:MAG: cation diffusion facilitator family transporter [Bacteroidales bacterium]|jgi:cation diffusion facilitator family transporter|nr:cation diffusion facilitator family transporter [Bacteroidales bacterium]MDD4702995.1 cation diffusion facilitator family transporter [Bacteroidales bacterium]MDX9798678.1 cation diffusion facilitator family transporter [Bacteroidales bacterium]
MEKWKFQRIIVIISSLILICKFGAYFITNSVGVYSDAMESIVNVVAGVISLLSLRWAIKPADNKHPFGHGKMELISASIEGILIIFAGGLIIYEAVSRMFSPPKELPKLEIGIIIVAIAGILNYMLGYWSIRKGKKTSSMALIASGKHLQSDTYSTIGLIVGLILIAVTGLIILDSILALVYGTIIIVTGAKILRKTVANLLDENNMEELKAIAEVINKHKAEDWIDIHNLRVVNYGNSLHIDCDLTLPCYYTINEGHQATEKLKQALQIQSDDLYFTVHSDSCDEKYCFQCTMTSCPIRKEPCTTPFIFSVENLIKQEED